MSDTMEVVDIYLRITDRNGYWRVHHHRTFDPEGFFERARARHEAIGYTCTLSDKETYDKQFTQEKHR